MPKGKQFNAAEKYFDKKRIEYEKRLKQNSQTIVDLNASVTGLIFKNQRLEDENNQLKEWVERLLQYTELSKKEIKQICEQDKAKGQAFVDFMGLTKLLSRYIR